jgi:hypothetical protein
MAATEIEIMCVTSQYASHIPHLLTLVRPSTDLSICLRQEEIVQQIRRACETVGLFYGTYPIPPRDFFVE